MSKLQSEKTIHSTMVGTGCSGEIIQFKNCRLVRNHKIVVDDLWIQNGKIIDPEIVFFDHKIGSQRKIDCDGAIIAPGFIDIQINGKSIMQKYLGFFLKTFGIFFYKNNFQLIFRRVWSRFY